MTKGFLLLYSIAVISIFQLSACSNNSDLVNPSEDIDTVSSNELLSNTHLMSSDIVPIDSQVLSSTHQNPDTVTLSSVAQQNSSVRELSSAEVLNQSSSSSALSSSSIVEAQVSSGSVIIEVEDYIDAYDVTVGNTGNTYREDDVDIGPSNSGHVVAWVSDTEWLEYTFSVPEAGLYDLTVFTSSKNVSSKWIEYTVNGSAVGEVTVPTTGSFEQWHATTVKEVSLSDGDTHTLRLTLRGEGYNLDYIEIKPSQGTKDTIPSEKTEFVNWGLPGLTVPHGFGVNIHFNGSEEHFPRYQEDLDLIAEAGIKVIRQDLFWHWIENEKGVLFWDHFDELVDACEQRGLQLLFILTYSNQLYEEHINSIYTQEGRDAWTHYATTAVERYKGKNIVWELWNEPNLYIFWLPEPDVDAYMALLDQAVPAIRAVDPDAILMASATSHIDLGWIEETFKRGLLNHIDAVSVHPYRHEDPETVIGDYYNLFNLINGYTGGQGKPVVSSEWGYSNINWDNAPLDDWEQARRLVRELLTNISMGIHISIWYDWMNDGTDPANREHNFGLVENDRVPKLAYYAYKALNETLNGYTFLRSIDAGTPGVYFLEFGKDDDRIYVFWKQGAHEVREIQSSIGNVEIVSMMGDTQTITWTGTAFSHLFTNAPQYMIVPRSQ
ncbi:MAG: cellulase family glycosylhydrolase [Fibrobacterales bacterium]